MANARRVIDHLRRELPVEPPSVEMLSFAEAAQALGPSSLIEEAETAIAAGEPTRGIARIVAFALRGFLRDIDEHEAQAEHFADRTFIRRKLPVWLRRAGSITLVDEVILSPDLSQQVVAEAEYSSLPPAEARAWRALRRARRLAPAIAKLKKTKLAPWFAELIAAYIAREIEQISLGGAVAWQAALDDVPDLLRQLPTLGWPQIFTQRVLRAANRVVARHAHEPSRQALAALGVLGLSERDRQRVERERRASAARARAAGTRPARRLPPRR